MIYNLYIKCLNNICKISFLRTLHFVLNIYMWGSSVYFCRVFHPPCLLLPSFLLFPFPLRSLEHVFILSFFYGISLFLNLSDRFRNKPVKGDLPTHPLPRKILLPTLSSLEHSWISLQRQAEPLWDMLNPYWLTSVNLLSPSEYRS